LPKEAPKPGKFKVANGGAQAAGDDKVPADAPAEKEGA
jgi:large subunit ribosomal protein L3